VPAVANLSTQRFCVNFKNAHKTGDSIMADIVSELASRCGMSTETAQKGLGAVLGFLKSKLPTEAFNKLSDAVPGADSMMSSAADTQEKSGGVISAVKGAVGKLFGGGDSVGGLLSKLGQFGMTPEQIQGFIPRATELLKDKLPENILSQVSDVLPTSQESAH
jgi:hypothetical protein